MWLAWPTPSMVQTAHYSVRDWQASRFAEPLQRLFLASASLRPYGGRGPKGESPTRKKPLPHDFQRG